MMRANKTTAYLLAGLMCCCLLSRSCANTTTPPGGGPKDTIPPVLVKVIPDQYATGFPLVKGKVTLQFDEYTVIKNSSDIFLSPPTKKKPLSAVKGKGIVVTMQDTLQPDRTYTIDFGQALADNNEGNLAPRYVYTFSTGDVIDSMYFTGSIVDCQTLKPAAKMLVAAYTDLSDSACFNVFPDAASRSDDWGFFTLRNIKPAEYRIIAFTDEDGDSKYNPDADNVAFLDTLFTPTAVVNDSIYELRGFNMKDTAKCAARVPMITLSAFKELQSVQYLQNYGRLNEKFGFLKFSAANVDIRNLEFYGIDSTDVLLQYNPSRDSINFWITSRYRLDDSLLVRIDYMKTDSTGVLAEFSEAVAMAMPTDTNILKKIKEHEKDTTFKLKATSTNETVEQEGIILESEDPILEFVLDSLRFTETNPKNQTEDKQVIFTRDTAEIRRFVIRPDCELQIGYDYKLIIPQGTFVNMYGLPNVREEIKIALPNDENLSSLALNVTGADMRYIVELLDEKMSQTFRRFTINADGKLNCPYLKAGKYAIRITQDRNGNGIFDVGNLLERRQPEVVKVFTFENGDNLIEILERTDLEQDINLKELFR